jgi:hypothetical protein
MKRRIRILKDAGQMLTGGIIIRLKSVTKDGGIPVGSMRRKTTAKGQECKIPHFPSDAMRPDLTPQTTVSSLTQRATG